MPKISVHVIAIDHYTVKLSPLTGSEPPGSIREVDEDGLLKLEVLLKQYHYLQRCLFRIHSGNKKWALDDPEPGLRKLVDGTGVFEETVEEVAGGSATGKSATKVVKNTTASYAYIKNVKEWAGHNHRDQLQQVGTGEETVEEVAVESVGLLTLLYIFLAGTILGTVLTMLFLVWSHGVTAK